MTKPQDNNQDSNQAATTVKPLTEEHAESIFSRLFAKYFGKKEPEQTESPAINSEQPSEPKEGQQFKQEGWDGFSKSVQLLEKLDEKIEAQQNEYNALRAEFDKFKAEIEAAPYTGQRQEHSGSQSADRIVW